MKVKWAIVAAGVITVTLAAASQAVSRSVWDGVYTNEQAMRGQDLYSSKCATCHGDQLEGMESAPALAGSDFISNWDGRTADTLFDRIHTTMPADQPGKLSGEQVADVMAYIFSQNKFPAGNAELPHEAETLKQISLNIEKPAK